MRAVALGELGLHPLFDQDPTAKALAEVRLGFGQRMARAYRDPSVRQLMGGETAHLVRYSLQSKPMWVVAAPEGRYHVIYGLREFMLATTLVAPDSRLTVSVKVLAAGTELEAVIAAQRHEAQDDFAALRALAEDLCPGDQGAQQAAAQRLVQEGLNLMQEKAARALAPQAADPDELAAAGSAKH